MKILFLSHYFPPEVNAPASRTFEHCRAWVADGHDVTVVTCAPNHPSGIVYPGYKNALFKTERIAGIRVVRLWTFIAANEGFALRTLNYASYAFAVAVAALRLPRPDIVVSTSPQFFCGLSGLVVQKMRRVPWVLEVRDLWPESIMTVGAMRKGRVINALEWLERWAYRSADYIVPVTDSFVAHISDRGGDRDRMMVIKNGVDLSLFKPDPAGAERIRLELGLHGKFIAAYVGTHGMAHGLDLILDAALALRDDPRIAFVLVGDGAERAHLEQRRQALGLDNVAILGQRPKQDMPAIWTATDVSLILLRANPAFRKVIPSKMFEAMALARPIILGVEGEAEELLTNAGAGLAIAPGDVDALVGAIRTLADDPARAATFGANGQSYAQAHFDRTTLAAKYAAVLTRVAERKHRPAVQAAPTLSTPTQ